MGEFIYEKETAPCGVGVETIYGAEERSAKVWKLFAMQIFSEAEGDYRTIEHLENGAPVLDGIEQRISLTHTSHFMAIASLPKTPEENLTEVSLRTALGIDAEMEGRRQVLKIKDKFLNEDELRLLPAVSDPEKGTEQEVRDYILAWTCKEALYKADLGIAPDWKNDYRIISLPLLSPDMKNATADKYGKGVINDPEAGEIEMFLSSWISEGHVVTVAFSPKIVRFPRQ